MVQKALSSYLVEVEPRCDAADPGTVASRARSSAGGVRFLRSIYVPEDDRWFLLYEAASADDVAAAAVRADAVVISIAEARSVRGDEASATEIRREER
jgi:hypothetical protein